MSVQLEVILIATASMDALTQAARLTALMLHNEAPRLSEWKASLALL